MPCIGGLCNLIRLKFISFDETLSDKGDRRSLGIFVPGLKVRLDSKAYRAASYKSRALICKV